MPKQSKKKTPNPGSDEAIVLGCNCPVIDNCHGKGGDPFGNFWINQTCPIHGQKSAGPTPRSGPMPAHEPLPTEVAVVEAWAIIDPDGEILLWTVHKYQDESIRMAAFSHIDLKTHDCVRVYVSRSRPLGMVGAPDAPAGASVGAVSEDCNIDKIQAECNAIIKETLSDLNHPERMGRTKAAFRIRDFCETLRNKKE